MKRLLLGSEVVEEMGDLMPRIEKRDEVESRKEGWR
jgi:hypothetical protein